MPTWASGDDTESPAGLVALVAALVDDARDAFVAGVTHFRALNPYPANLSQIAVDRLRKVEVGDQHATAIGSIVVT